MRLSKAVQSLEHNIVVTLVFCFNNLQALMKLARESNGTVMCIRSKDTFKYSEVKKVFVM